MRGLRLMLMRGAAPQSSWPGSRTAHVLSNVGDTNIGTAWVLVSMSAILPGPSSCPPPPGRKWPTQARSILSELSDAFVPPTEIDMRSSIACYNASMSARQGVYAARRSDLPQDRGNDHAE